jgi:hypothetical protein
LSGAKVLDSWALLCYLEQESGFEKIIQVFEEAVNDSQPLLMTVINWGVEVDRFHVFLYIKDKLNV